MNFTKKFEFYKENYNSFLKLNFLCKKYKGYTSENLRIKIFYKRKISKNLVLELKFYSESIANGIKLVWMHPSALKFVIRCIYILGSERTLLLIILSYDRIFRKVNPEEILTINHIQWL